MMLRRGMQIRDAVSFRRNFSEILSDLCLALLYYLSLSPELLGSAGEQNIGGNLKGSSKRGFRGKPIQLSDGPTNTSGNRTLLAGTQPF
jgi:hypothetical protein